MDTGSTAGNPSGRFSGLAQKFRTCKIFRTQLKDQLRHYISSLPTDEQTACFDNKAFIEQHDRHWQIEQYHRGVKQICNIERFQVRSKGAIKNHFFAAICGFVQLQKLGFAAVINNCYSLQRNLFKDVIASLFVAAMLSLVLSLI